MSESEAAATDRGNDYVVEDDCPLCLEPLPPFWDDTGEILHCCGKRICRDCNEKQREHLGRAAAEGSFGRHEEQLSKFCPLCRGRYPVWGTDGVYLQQKFDDGCLPLRLYETLALCYGSGEGGIEQDGEKLLLE